MAAAAGTFPATAVVHYNMLHGVDRAVRDGGRWDFEAEPVFRGIVRSGRVDRCLVLVAPRGELLDRARQRAHVELDSPSSYPTDYWLNALSTLNLPGLYEILFTLLDRLGIPYEVVYSSAYIPSGFAPSDRVFVHANLRGHYIDLPARDEVTRVANDGRCHYQSVLLPLGLTTTPKGYDHVAGGRHRSFERALPSDLADASILDIGSALGDLLFNAERRGASRLVGIELNEDRYEGAVMLAGLLASRAEFHNVGFLDYNASLHFDHVFLMNVLHHVADFETVLRRAADICLRSLTLEFPTLTDPRFRAARGVPAIVARVLNRFPVIGVSRIAGTDQTYVYAPPAIRGLVMDQIGGFSSWTVLESPIQNRVIMQFWKPGHGAVTDAVAPTSVPGTAG